MTSGFKPHGTAVLGGLVSLLLIGGCLYPFDAEKAGYRCTTDTECGAGLSCVVGFCAQPGSSEADGGDALAFPLRAAFFNGAYPYNWGTQNNQSHDVPSWGYYDSEDAGVISLQLAAASYAHVQAFFYSWYGATQPSDVVFDEVLGMTDREPMRWAVVYERETSDHPSSTDVRLILGDLATKYGTLPNYLRVDGGFVVVVPTDVDAGCDASARWMTGLEDSRAPAFILMRTGLSMPDGGLGCERQPNAWYRGYSTQPIESTNDTTLINPGAWVWDDSTPRLTRDPLRFGEDVGAMVDGGRRFQVIRTFNDWKEGSAVEPSLSWPSDSGFGVYLDALH